MAKDAAREVGLGLELAPDEARQARTVSLAGGLGQEARPVSLEGPIEHGVLGLAAWVGRRGEA
jgi:hypothetical protein